MGEDRIMFSSRDTNTEIIVSRVEGNENYDEENVDQF